MVSQYALAGAYVDEPGSPRRVVADVLVGDAATRSRWDGVDALGAFGIDEDGGVEHSSAARLEGPFLPPFERTSAASSRRQVATGGAGGGLITASPHDVATGTPRRRHRGDAAVALPSSRI